MKYSVAFVALAAVAAQAQSLADVPKCAIPCLDKAIASETSCDKTDLACVCKGFSAVRSKATSCVIDECGTDVAINEVLPATENLCKNPPKESEAKSTAEEEKPTTTVAATSTLVVVTTSAEVVETTAAATTTVAPIIPTTAAEEPATSTPAAATPTKGPEQANGAAGLKGLGALAMAAFAALAL
ncbi:hypothetical protein FAUST_11314 [Fusarium austroamericanum]|uniref:CFEM domain-containing protein n=1 Tax=Fusarium austroamericanum TaxID=282268 RepID=A0AAN5Z005_FUSAU|nr:hypothetical protein FAUST_11314 [Fusarium austroamericanum]